jgi:hypothetical protein
MMMLMRIARNVASLIAKGHSYVERFLMLKDTVLTSFRICHLLSSQFADPFLTRKNHLSVLNEHGLDTKAKKYHGGVGSRNAEYLERVLLRNKTQKVTP